MQGRSITDMTKADQVLHLKEVRPLQLTLARETAGCVEGSCTGAEEPGRSLPACVRSAPPVVAAVRSSPACFGEAVDAAAGGPTAASQKSYDQDEPLDPHYLIPAVGLR